MEKKEIKKIYLSEGRYYHGWCHIKYLLDEIRLSDLSEKEKDILSVVALYHDIVYDPRSPTNEEDSAAFFRKNFEPKDYPDFDKSDIDLVEQIIVETKHGVETTSRLSSIFSQYDNAITQQDFSKLLQWEDGIMKEYQIYPYPEYKKGRVEFLKTLPQTDGIKKLIEYVQNRRIKIGIYAGSFNPFHIGHQDIVRQAQKVFDKVIIAQLVNPEKKSSEPLENRFHNEVMVSDRMLHEIAEEVYEYGDVSIIRGLRNGSDLEYETNIMRWVHELADQEFPFVFFNCKTEFEHISSSAIRQLQKVGRDVSKYIP